LALLNGIPTPESKRLSAAACEINEWQALYNSCVT
jgi:hypothetical protein